jgi:hypothetical protein
MHHPVKNFLGGEPARRLQALQHIELGAASHRTKCVGRAGRDRPPNHIWMVGDQLHHNRPAGRVPEHMYRPAEMLGQCSCVDRSDLGPGDIDAHSRPTVGKEHFEAGTGEWPHGAQAQLSLQPRRRVVVVRCAAR